MDRPAPPFLRKAAFRSDLPTQTSSPLNTSLQFTGDLAPMLGVFLAVALAGFAFFLYRREIHHRGDKLRWLLPALRSGAIFLAVLALTGPVLHHERVIRELGKLFVFVDGSKSMLMTDYSMAPERKVASMQAMGMLQRPDESRRAAKADALLSRAQFVARRAIAVGPESPDLADLARSFHEDVAAACKSLESFDGEIPELGDAAGQLLAQRFRPDSRFFDRGFRLRAKDHPPAEQTRFLSEFRFPGTTETDFVVWIRAYLVPPADGQYRFWLSSDDRGELWLSPDDNPDGARRIARMSSWTEELDFDATPEQRSTEVALRKGQRYFIEAVLQADSGLNHLSVAWQTPRSDSRIAPIPGEFFIPFPPMEGDANRGLRSSWESLLGKAGEFHEKLAAGSGDPFEHIETFKELDASAAALTTRLREYVLGAASAYLAANRDAEPLLEKLAEFDAMSRKDRVERLLLREDTGVLPLLAASQDIEFVALRDNETDPLWWQRRGGRKSAGPLPSGIKLSLAGQKTDLGETVKAAIGDAGKGVGVLVYSDGQHNTAGSPVTTAEMLGQQGIPVFAVGTGSINPPEDMAVVEVVAPETVFAKDQAKGHIKLRDTMRHGGEFELVIRSGDQPVWSESFEADGRGQREFEYQFPVAPLVQAYQEQHAVDEIEAHSVPLSLEVHVAPLSNADPIATDSGGKEPLSGTKARASRDLQLKDNDRKPLYLQAIAQPRKLLIIDSRPRWETRYLHNMFERDEQWQVNVLMGVVTGGGHGGTWKRGDQEGTFPDSREELFSYESIFIGDVPRRMFEEEEMEWLLEFVENRGGGIVFIDGQRGNLRGYGDTPIEKLLPVQWRSTGGVDRPEGGPGMPERVRLSSAGVEFAPLRFAPTGAENKEIWERLRPPHWCAPTEALPGAELLASAEFAEGTNSPVLVWRRLGAGKVLFSATDELWRWRYNVADRYHQKFWTQICNWVGERPFSVAGPRASIGSDKLVYEPGEQATLRVRVRDENGKPAAGGEFVAVVYDGGGKTAAEIELAADENGGGMFRGKSGELEPGEYNIAVRRKYLVREAKEFDARAPLIVKPASDIELDELTLNRDLLKAIARSSGGQYFEEEESRNLVNLLESIDRKKVIPSQTVLWSSFWWFAAIIGLLTTEWVLRKRAGLV